MPCHSRPGPVRRVQGRIWPDARVRLRPAGRRAGRRGRQSAQALPAGDRARLQFGGVIYTDSADKAARFIMDCNQTRLPILFLQNVNGFMVGRDAEQSGIIRAGAKLVNVISNSVVPKITLILGGSFGAGQLRPVRQSVRPALHHGLAERSLCRHGRRPGGQHAARHHRQRLETRRPRTRRRGTGGIARQR